MEKVRTNLYTGEVKSEGSSDDYKDEGGEDNSAGDEAVDKQTYLTQLCGIFIVKVTKCRVNCTFYSVMHWTGSINVH